MSRLLLASGSPRRRQLLAQLGLELEVAASNVDEAVQQGESPRGYVARIARAKGEAVGGKFPGRVVLSADTSVVKGGRIFGKPLGEEGAVEMLRELSGGEHLVLTAVRVAGPRGAFEEVVETRVLFREIPAEEARWYARTGEPLDKAGGYGIQDRGGMFVSAIHGSYSNVVGLPLAEALALLSKAGLPLPWRPS